MGLPTAEANFCHPHHHRQSFKAGKPPQSSGKACKDWHSLTRIDDAFAYHVAASTWLSSLDLLSGYWQVKLAPKARPKTAFLYQTGTVAIPAYAFPHMQRSSYFRVTYCKSAHIYSSQHTGILTGRKDFGGTLSNLRKIRDWLKPANVSQLRNFL